MPSKQSRIGRTDQLWNQDRVGITSRDNGLQDQLMSQVQSLGINGSHL